MAGSGPGSAAPLSTRRSAVVCKEIYGYEIDDDDGAGTLLLLVLFGEAEAGNGLLSKESCVNLSTAAGREHVAVVRLSRL